MMYPAGLPSLRCIATTSFFVGIGEKFPHSVCRIRLHRVRSTPHHSCFFNAEQFRNLGPFKNVARKRAVPLLIHYFPAVMSEEPQTRVTRTLTRIQNNRFAAVCVILGVIVIGVGSFTEAVSKIVELISPKPKVENIPIVSNSPLLPTPKVENVPTVSAPPIPPTPNPPYAPTAKSPPWVRIAWDEMGMRDKSQSFLQSRVADYLTVFGSPVTSAPKDWSAAFISWCLNRAGRPIVSGNDNNLFLKYGERLAAPTEGCIVMFRFPSSAGISHVGFYLYESMGRIAVIGGNQSDAVSVSHFSKTSVVAYIQPNAP